MNMRHNLILAALAGMVALPLQGGTDLNARVETLEHQLGESQIVREALQADVRDLKASLAEVQTYLQAQAAADRDFKGVVKVVEDGGFAFGQNWQSKKDLLDGLRALSDARQKKLPGSKQKGK